MDPLSIISLGAAAAQFADFGIRLLTKTADVYQDAAAAGSRVAALEAISHNLTALSRQISERMAPLKKKDRLLTTSELALLEQCRRCQEASAEVLHCVSEIKGLPPNGVDRAKSDTNPHSFRVALRAVWKEDKICKMEARLVGIKNTLMTALIADLWYARLASREIHNVR